MIIEHRVAATCMLLSALCLTLTCAFLCASSAGQDSADKIIEVPLTDATPSGSPLEVHGKALIHEVIAGPKLEWSWGERVVVKNASDKAITLLFATLTELGRHPESGRPAGLGDGPRYVIAEDRFFSETDIRPSDSVVLRNTKPRALGEGCCINSIDKVRVPQAEFKVLFLQYADGSIFGDPAAASGVFTKRQRILAALRQLTKPLAGDVEENFAAEVKVQCGSLGNPICPRISVAFERSGYQAAVTEARRLLGIAEKHVQLLTPYSAN
jgi:hypothetical protein